MLIYLHGFRSGPQSQKAQQLGARMTERGLADQWWCEQLVWGPATAIAQVSRIIEACSELPTLVGSSLGGFYATWLAERYALRAVLVNPAVLSHITLATHLGPQQMLYTDEHFDFTTAHLEELRALEAGHLGDPSRYWLLAETGDEVLDYRGAVARYAGARQTVLAGGDHSFTRWDDYLDGILKFAGLIDND
ncbi:MAG: esterase [Rhodocyclales bacterium]|nr:esterase [Rhodocyclales bacterium]